MTNFFVETSLLMLGLFLAGCILGCIARRLFGDEMPATVAAVKPQMAPAPVRTAPADARIAPKPELRPAATVAPRPAQPVPAVKAPVVKAPVKVDEAFRRADVDKPVALEPKAQVASQTTSPAPQPGPAPIAPTKAEPATPRSVSPSAPTATKPEAIAPRPVVSTAPVAARVKSVTPRPTAPPAPVVNVRPAPAPQPTPAAPAPTAAKPQPAPTSVAPTTAAKPAQSQAAEPSKPTAPSQTAANASALAAATAAAAAAAIAEGRARDRKAGDPIKTAAQQPRLELPTVAATPGVGAVAVSGRIQEARAPAAPGDDLKRIQAISPEIEAGLNKLGIRRYGDIAGWSAQEVARVTQTLGLRGRIEQENWIEQAQVLTKGVATAYSAKYDRGDQVPSAPVHRPAAEAQTAEPKSAMAAAALAAANAMSTAKTPAPQPSASIAAATAAAEKVASVVAPVVTSQPRANNAAERAKQLASTLAAPIAPAPAAAKPSAPTQASTSPPAPAPQPTAAPAVPSPQPPPETIASGDDLKRIRGIDRDLERLLNRLGVASYDSISRWSPNEIGRFGAALGLATGRIQRESWVEQARVLAGANKPPEPTLPSAANDEARSRQRMVSVKSEALQDRFETGQSRSVRNVRSGIPDDLKRIKGIGVVLEKKLNGIGVISYEQVANWTDADVKRVSEQLDFKGRIERENWIEQARILATGGMTEFARRFDRGEVETPPRKV